MALENVYTAVKAFKDGHAAKSPEIMKYYAQLVKDGITGIGVD